MATVVITAKLKQEIKDHAYRKLFDKRFREFKESKPDRVHFASVFYDAAFDKTTRDYIASAPDPKFFPTGSSVCRVYLARTQDRVSVELNLTAYRVPAWFHSGINNVVDGDTPIKYRLIYGGVILEQPDQFGELGEYLLKINEQYNSLTKEKDEFLAGVDDLLSKFKTLSPALKRWRPLWDILPPHVQERHNKVTGRKSKRSEEVEINADLRKMTAKVVHSKLEGN